VADVVRIGSDAFVCELACDTPAAVEVPPGSTLAIHCRSAADRLVGAGPIRADGPNPATGPIAVAGARPGQALRFDILDIACESPGHVSAGWDGGVQAVEIRGGHAMFHGIEIPIAPMIGVLGVAPAAGAWSTMAAGCFGGNMDTNDVAPGAAVIIPIHQPGGRFVVGDVHAVMGDGEIGGQGLECAATVTLRVGIEPQPPSDHVVIHRDDWIMTVGAAERVEDAVRDAAVAMMKLIKRAGILDEFNAMKLLGLIGQTRFGQHCCPIKCVRVAVPLAYVPGLRLKQGGR
jgi:amidase